LVRPAWDGRHVDVVKVLRNPPQTADPEPSGCLVVAVSWPVLARFV